MSDRIYETFFNPGEVVEIRAMGLAGKGPWDGFARGQGTVSGYFDNAKAFHDAVQALEKNGPPGIYFVVNPCRPELLARANNRLKANPKATTQDSHVVCRRWFLIDLDPARPSGISSSDEELGHAIQKAEEIAGWLEGELGLAPGIRAMSGNGFHLDYRLPDLPNDDYHTEIVRRALRALKEKYQDSRVIIDQSIYNAARIWKVYSTTARKGDALADRPHRKAYISKGQPSKLADVPITPLEKLQALAALAPSDPHPPSSDQTTRPAPPAPRKAPSDLGSLNVGAYLSAHGREYKTKEQGATTLYVLRECVFNPEHQPWEASICQSPSPPWLTYQCFHSSCKGRTWKEARQQISGDQSLAPYCANYDPAWRTATRIEPGTGALHNINIPMVMQESFEHAPVLPPNEIEAREFFERRGKRPTFVPSLLAKYFAVLLDPIVHTDDLFWRYDNGVWRPYPRSSIFQIGVHTLKEVAQPDWIEKGIKLLAGLVNRKQEEWPGQGDLVNCLNGMVDPKTKTLLPHDPAYGSKTQVPCRFDKEARPERWLRFLPEVFPEDFGVQKAWVLQQFSGYCLLQDCRYQCALFLYGTGANGKSTVLNTLEAMVGRENTATLTISDLGQRFQLQFLEGKLINIATETNTKDPTSTEQFKQAVGGDPMRCERKYGDPYSFRPFAKFLIAMNEPPIIPDKSFGFSRRIIVLNFSRRFREDEMDRQLGDKLAAEKDGIFTWAIEGLYFILGTKGFNLTSRVTEDTKNLITTMNPLLLYIDECCILGENCKVPTSELYEHYKNWCREGGNRALSRNRFYDQILMNFPEVHKERHGGREERRVMFFGIGLKVAP
jgi:P4 family phage/plasmid primase-like protien